MVQPRGPRSDAPTETRAAMGIPALVGEQLRLPKLL